jgi:hypothetical protein
MKRTLRVIVRMVTNIFAGPSIVKNLIPCLCVVHNIEFALQNLISRRPGVDCDYKSSLSPGSLAGWKMDKYRPEDSMYHELVS